MSSTETKTRAAQADWTGALARARAHAPFLADAIDKQPDLAGLLAGGDLPGALAMARAAGHAEPEAGAALRRERLALALTLGMADLAGALPLARVMHELSGFADRALDTAIRDAIVQRTPDADFAGFCAIALGKQGAEELNYSSDIDPILLFDPTTLPHRPREEAGEAAQRIARTVVQTLSARTELGYVFRVDLRLRPASEVSPLAIPLLGAISHYESSALAWERAAYIRSRACAGDTAMGQAFLDTIRPFVWRRSLDFGAIAEIAALTLRIREHYAAGQQVGPGFDLKRGRGGIREVEFFAQVHQLIHGGRDPSLRLRGTRPALDALAEAGIIDAEDASVLGTSYDRLRTIEHRLQMVSDQQTHALPANAQALDNVARLDGLAGGAELVAEVAAISDAVGARYDALLATVAPKSSTPRLAPSPAAPPLRDQLATLGFADTDTLAARIEGWTNGSTRALRSAEARTAFDAMRPALLAALAEAPEPMRALLRWEQVLANLPSAINVFRLLEARPGLLAILVKVLAHAPTLADELARRADLIDILIDRTAFDLPGSVDEIAAGLSRGEAGDDYQRLLDRVRLRVGELRFALGVQLIDGACGGGAGSDPLDVAAALARVAQAAIMVLGDAATREFERVHGQVPDSRMAILGLGRLGGGALTHASDLDLVFLFSGDFMAESEGPKPLGGTLYFNRLAQRVIAALSVPTAAGALYDVDVRLRPSGAQGPLAVSFESFARYQREQAWTWEHMALMRARPVYGEPGDRAALTAIIASVVAQPRDPATLCADALKMRGDIAQHKPAKGPLDVKLLRGGLVDVEFIVHVLQLRERVALTPDLRTAIAELASAGLVAADFGAAHDLLTRLLVAVRLMAPDGTYPPPASQPIVARLCGQEGVNRQEGLNRQEGWDSLLGSLRTAREAVAAQWAATFGETIALEEPK
jgi:glutamate-ammonia-ligase adenylyltransferase